MGHGIVRDFLLNTFPSPRDAGTAATAGGARAHLRVHSFAVFVRDVELSLAFYVGRLGFRMVSNSAPRSVVLAPPDGTALLVIVAPMPGSEEYQLVGKGRLAVFVTDDITGTFQEWSGRGVKFSHPPQAEAWGGTVTGFEDVDGNRFSLVGFGPADRELGAHRRASQELQMAREAQARLLPLAQPAARTLEYAGLCTQARQVGGDYYDFLELGRGRLGLLVGDVSGKGIAAAILMSNLQAHVRNVCAAYSSRPFVPIVAEQPQRALQTVNRLFFESTADDAYATLFFAEYNDASRRLRYANCGHVEGLLLRRAGGLEKLGSTCTVLGLFRDWECAVGEVELEAGDVLAIYSDGAVECPGEGGEEFGEARLEELLWRSHGATAANAAHSVLREIQTHSGEEQADDITLIVAKCR